MPSKSPKLLPKEQEILKNLGEKIKLARLRRKLTTEQVANRANISRKSLWHIEKGSDHISVGMFLKVFSVLGLRKDFEHIGSDDVLTRKLQDLELKVEEQNNRSQN